MLVFHKNGFACIAQHFTPMKNFMQQPTMQKGKRDVLWVLGFVF
jgi:hypothetical protein